MVARLCAKDRGGSKAPVLKVIGHHGGGSEARLRRHVLNRETVLVRSSGRFVVMWFEHIPGEPTRNTADVRSFSDEPVAENRPVRRASSVRSIRSTAGGGSDTREEARKRRAPVLQHAQQRSAREVCVQFEFGPFSEASIGNVGLRPNTTGWVDHVVTPAGALGIMIAEDALIDISSSASSPGPETVWSALSPGRS